MSGDRLEHGRRLLGTLLLVLALAVPTAAGAGLAVSGAPKRLELDTVRLRFTVRGTVPPLRDVVLVAIDRESLAELGSSWPLPRRWHADAIDRLAADGARQIAYDVEFPGGGVTAGERRGSAAIRAAARRAGNVVFAAFAPDASGQTNVLAPGAGRQPPGVQTGFSGIRTANGLPASTVPVAVSGLESLSAAVARRAGADIAAGPGSETWIAFAGPPGTVPRVRFSDVLEDRLPAAALRGKVVVVAATDPAVKDVVPTVAPGGEQMSGGELQANAIATWLRDRPLRSAPAWLDAVLIALMGLVLPLVGVRGRQRTVWAAAVVLLATFLVAAQLLFDDGVVTLMVAPLVSLVVAAAASLALALRRAERERQALRARFAAGDPSVGPLLDHDIGTTSIVAGYRLEELLARGGMGVVYRATQLALDRPVAIKLITPEHTADPVFRARFELESRVAAGIEHPNVIPVYETGDDDGLLFIAMRLVDGIDLARLVARVGPLRPDLAVRLVAQAAAALDAAHAGDLVHRDVKPGNLLLTSDDPAHVYLTDFGLARHAGPSTGLTRGDGWVGTLDYLAPEQMRGDPVDARADVYALAGVLHFCLTGRPPFVAETPAAIMWAHLNAPAPQASTLASHIPPGLDDVVAAGLAKDPADRPASARALARAAMAAVAPADGAAAPRDDRPPAPTTTVDGPTVVSDGA